MNQVVKRAVILLLFASLFSDINAQKLNLPNVIYILSDDLGYGDVHCFNPESKIPTPNIDALAKEGMRFTDAHASASVCTPSRYSILTGRYNWRSQLQESVLFGYDSALIEPGRMTVGELYQKNGYYTACVGKWNLGMDWPLKHGFDSVKTGWEIDYSKPIGNSPDTKGFNFFYGISGSLDMPPYVYIQNNKVVEIPTVTKGFSMQNRLGPTTPGFKPEDVLPNLTAEAQDLIIERSKSGSPFFLYFALPSPHTPIVPNDDFKGRSGVTAYGDYVMETDWAVGQIMKTLNSLKISGNTLIIFTSDNGFAPYVLSKYNVEELGHYPSYVFRGYKADIWDGGHRLPFIARWPGVIPEGAENNDLISLTDFFATSADILGVELPPNVAEDSYSIFKDLSNEKTSPARPAIVYHSINGYFAIQKGRWKLEFCPGSGGWASPNNVEAFKEGLPNVQLYDMTNDISEKYNLEAIHPEIVKELTTLMKKYISNGRSTPGLKQKNDVVVDLWKQTYSQ